MVNIAVLVSGGGTNLQALIDKQGSVITSGQIKLVISNVSSAYALQRAKNAGIEAIFISKKEAGSQEAFEEKIVEALQLHNIDMIVLAGFMSVLSEKFTSRYPKKIINIHPSLIPSFCGKGMYGIHVHEAALAYGVKVSGATVHYVNEICDGGQIILQKAVEVLDDDTPQSLQLRIMEQAEWNLLPQATEMVAKRIGQEKENERL